MKQSVWIDQNMSSQNVGFQCHSAINKKYILYIYFKYLWVFICQQSQHVLCVPCARRPPGCEACTWRFLVIVWRTCVYAFTLQNLMTIRLAFLWLLKILDIIQRSSLMLYIKLIFDISWTFISVFSSLFWAESMSKCEVKFEIWMLLPLRLFCSHVLLCGGRSPNNNRRRWLRHCINIYFTLV
jgi:hypothetical protein